jgi:hypothetical protein
MAEDPIDFAGAPITGDLDDRRHLAAKRGRPVVLLELVPVSMMWPPKVSRSTIAVADARAVS